MDKYDVSVEESTDKVWLYEAVLETVKLLEKGKKVQLELDGNGNLKVLNIKTTVVMRKE